ncbi:transmembrane protein 255A isoform X2 [Salmo trutta]|uniref:transmembrane protein 255A isoform X2 n=1 Tax=Salmo trutta TaxID=8032 RepID=UPI0011309D41|nr:transmembrane protein 255A-like isoform X2 [Salmo trutta]
MPRVQNQQPGFLTETPMGSFKKRKQKSIMVTVMLLILSVLILVFGLAATTRTQNITVSGYYPGILLGLGSFLGIIGAHLIEDKRQMWKGLKRAGYLSRCGAGTKLVASIMFISFGVVAAFCCAIVDGVFAARHIDLRPYYAGRCDFHANSKPSVDYEDVHCQTAARATCNLRVKSNTCYCCDLYNCGKSRPPTSPAHWPSRVELMGGYHEYTEVGSCEDVVHLYHLLWSVIILNIAALFLGIITAAVLGGFKDLTPMLTPDLSESEPLPAAPFTLVFPAPSSPSFNPNYNIATYLPPYTAYDLQGSSMMFPDSSGLSDDSQSGASHIEASRMWPTLVPPRYSPPYFPPDEKPPPYSP